LSGWSNEYGDFSTPILRPCDSGIECHAQWRINEAEVAYWPIAALAYELADRR
jgi:hypothetical protein